MSYNLVVENPESTVVSEYQPLVRKEASYQSEAALEKSLIEQLKMQAYEYLPLTSEKQLISNLRTQLEKLQNDRRCGLDPQPNEEVDSAFQRNDAPFKFSDNEWKNFFDTKIANKNYDIEDKTAIIQEDHIQLLTRDDGTIKNIYLIDKENIHNNRLQVINQYSLSPALSEGEGDFPPSGGLRGARYDVTILVNGLPLVHIELKRRGVDLKEAFNQINRYSRESFWAGSGLFEYVQLFVISNGTYTKYYSNTTRSTHIKEMETSKPAKGKRSSNSYEFTSWWADANNRPITDLLDFANTFFAKHAILNILTKYCVFTSEKLLLAMRPYQIVATERILGRITISNNYKNFGTIKAGGYIWHTTGSGKTLTSFKTAQIASKLPFIDKVLFVVDRKDLDYQTMKEYDKFEKGAANSNTSTAKLKRQLEDPTARIIITTIQKLSILIKKDRHSRVSGKHLTNRIEGQARSVLDTESPFMGIAGQARNDYYNQPMVIIFDECHRSQFGDMHVDIKKAFKKYYLFGFTGTPIFAKNASRGGRIDLSTTEQAFGDKLHTYTIVDAINDKNVLPFRIDYIRTMREEENIKDEKVWNIDREKALASPERITKIVSYIREHFDQKNKRNSFYKLKDRRLAGFNSIFAVSSIDVAKKYYTEFQKQIAGLPGDQQLKVATIFSYAANEDVDGILGDENPEDTSKLDKSSRDFLEAAMQDYNGMFKTTFDTSSDKFQNYYKDVSQRVKDREIDLLIVVNMFLTGFDATTLNTLWVDKNLRLHGLLQAFSRTNRILNSVKTFGNIVCFRNLEDATNESIALFGDKEAGGIVLLKAFDDYYYGYIDTDLEKGTKKEMPGYETLVTELIENFPLPGHCGLDPQSPLQHNESSIIIGEQNQKEFIKLYGSILKFKNILSTFDEFIGKEILPERDVQDYHSMYISLYQEFRNKQKGDSENINDDIVFEMELIKQVEINIDYILELIRQYHAGNSQDTEIIVKINKAVGSSMELRSKKDLIDEFINSLNPATDVGEDWQTFVEKKKTEELDRLIVEENLNKEETIRFVDNAFRDGYVQETGTALTKVLPPVSRFTHNGDRARKRETVIEKIKEFFNRFFDIISRKHEYSTPQEFITEENSEESNEIDEPTIHDAEKVADIKSTKKEMIENPDTTNASKQKPNMEKYQHPNSDTNVVDDLFLNSPNYFRFEHKNEPPTKENSLYLTITQQWFDEIVSGRKTVEYRQIKDTTLGRYFEIPKKKNDTFIINALLPEDALMDIDAFNNGIFCIVPKEYQYIRLAVGYNKDRDTALVRLKGACTMPDRLSDGRIYRFNDVETEGVETMSEEEYIHATYNENGELCHWTIGFELGEIVEVKKK